MTTPDAVSFRRAYEEQGYAVARGLLPVALCDEIRAAFGAEVRHYPGRLRRQATMRLEPHNVSPGGLVTNAIIHAHDLPEASFPRFRRACRAILTEEPFVRAIATLLGATPQLVQTIFFESGRGTSAHADSYFLDSTRVGSLVAAWIAVEDIDPGAGPFFLYPRSHRLGDAEGPATQRFASFETRMKALVHRYHREPSFTGAREVTELMDLLQEILAERQVPRVSLPLAKGDVAFWSSLTVHGSDRPTDPHRSRRSLTAHFIAEGDGLLTHRLATTPLRLALEGGLWMHEPGAHTGADATR
jgi:phytanoyl-CoA hydroxylase